MKYFKLIGLIFVCFNGLTQDVNSISKDKNAHSVLENSTTTLEIYDHKRYDFTRHYKVHLKNKFAKHLADIVLYYGDFRKIDYAQVIVRDENGKELEKYKLKDFEDMTLDFSSMYSDVRYKVLQTQTFPYPYSLEVSYKVSNDATLHYSPWQPQKRKMFIQQAELIVKDYTKNNLRYTSRLADEPIITENEDAKTHTWRLKNIPATGYESYNSYNEDYFPTVYLAPKNFHMDGYSGVMNDWNSFGNWISNLNATQNTFTDAEKRELLSLERSTTTETVKSVYKFLQNSTRYVSIQVGIGGYQPFQTSFVHKNKYGDCKALTYYTKSVLDVLNIESFYTLVDAGGDEENLIEDFPNAGFNHVILTVPTKEKDTLFLECTSQISPFGYTGTFTSNRKALLVDENQSRVIKTQHYGYKDNVQKTTATIELDALTSISNVILEKEFTGTQIEHDGFIWQYQNEGNRFRNWVVDALELGGRINIDSLTRPSLTNDIIPQGGFKMYFKNTKEAVKRGNRIFLTPSLYMNKSPFVPKEKNRKTNVRIRFGYQHKDAIIYKLNQKNYKVENKQSDVLIETKFGIYRKSISENDDSISVERDFILFEQESTPKDFPDFKSFLQQVRKYDKQKIVLINTES